MGNIYLVRHGQASFGAADYDQLSALGQQQCLALGQYLRTRGVQFEAVLRGSLRRHVQSLQAVAQGHGALPAALEWPGLNEYDGDALVAALGVDVAAMRAQNASAEGYKQHFRLLRQGMAQWMSGQLQPAGMPPYADWAAGIMAALAHVQAQCRGDVLVVSSGGPISTMVAQVLQAPPATSIELNLRIRNSALTEMAYSARRLQLQVFNHVPHLETPERAAWVSFA